MDDTVIALERYTLVLHHDYVYGDRTINLDEPISVSMVFNSTNTSIPTVTVVNEMLDRLRDYMLDKLKEEE